MWNQLKIGLRKAIVASLISSLSFGVEKVKTVLSMKICKTKGTLCIFKGSSYNYAWAILLRWMVFLQPSL